MFLWDVRIHLPQCAGTSSIVCMAGFPAHPRASCNQMNSFKSSLFTPLAYHPPTASVCQEANPCNPQGTLACAPGAPAQCTCKDHYTGATCSECQDGYFAVVAGNTTTCGKHCTAIGTSGRWLWALDLLEGYVALCRAGDHHVLSCSHS